jgi:hypothetical protein
MERRPEHAADAAYDDEYEVRARATRVGEATRGERSLPSALG